MLFAFPEFEVNLIDAIGPAQCAVITNLSVQIPNEAFQQNWHWADASETAKSCSYEVLVTDLLSTTVPYKQRIKLFMNFLTAVIYATNPDTIYSLPCQKLIDPKVLIDRWTEDEVLYSICNVRLYNITDSQEQEIVMDTVGLHTLGLPDFQIRFSGLDATTVAGLLWNYAYYVYEQGDVIENGNTLEGIATGSKWKCERTISLISPERLVLNMQVN